MCLDDVGYPVPTYILIISYYIILALVAVYTYTATKKGEFAPQFEKTHKLLTDWYSRYRWILLASKAKLRVKLRARGQLLRVKLTVDHFKLRVKLRARGHILRVKLTAVWFLVEPAKKQTHAKTHEHLFPLHLFLFYLCIYSTLCGCSPCIELIAILYNTHSYSPLVYHSPLSNQPIDSHPPPPIHPPNPLLISYAHNAIAQ